VRLAPQALDQPAAGRPRRRSGWIDGRQAHDMGVVGGIVPHEADQPSHAALARGEAGIRAVQGRLEVDGQL